MNAAVSSEIHVGQMSHLPMRRRRMNVAHRAGAGHIQEISFATIASETPGLQFCIGDTYI